jgi:tRNA pseudouridine55 synthase
MSDFLKHCTISHAEELLEGKILLVDKPLNWTSFDVVGKLKWILRSEGKFPKFKIGHAGTLDPLATGLLIVCTGKMTKSISDIQGGTKEYTGRIVLGATTPSFDKETLPGNFQSTEHLTLERLEEVAKTFIGEQLQMPPVYSAKQIDGVRAYEMARKNEEVKMRENLITIESFELNDFDGKEVSFCIRCSKGTYIRSIANDFGQRLGVGGYLSALRRTESFPFRVAEAKTPMDWVKLFYPSYSAVNEHFSDDSVKKVFTKAF